MLPHQRRRVRGLSRQREEGGGEEIPVLGEQRVRVLERRLAVSRLREISREKFRQTRVANRAKETGEDADPTETDEKKRARVLTRGVPRRRELGARGAVHERAKRVVVAKPKRRAQKSKSSPTPKAGPVPSPG